MAVPVTWADVVAIAPELADVAVPTQVALLAHAERLVNRAAWGTLADDGVKYLAAHLGTLTRSKGKGPVASEAVGSLSRSYGSLVALAGTWGQTSYGAHYVQLTRMLPTVLGAVY